MVVNVDRDIGIWIKSYIFNHVNFYTLYDRMLGKPVKTRFTMAT